MSGAHLLTGSKGELAMEHCNAFLSADSLWDNTSGPAAKTGTELHSLIERYIRFDAQHAAGTYKAMRMFWRWLEWAHAEGFDRGNWWAEVAIAYNPFTDEARRLDTNGPRDYSTVKEGEIALTIDALQNGLHDTGTDADRLFVRDWKSSRIATPATGNGQLAIAACAVSALYGIDDVDTQLVFIRDASPVEPSEIASLGPLEHAITRVKLRKAMTPRAANPGSHCWENWCPSRNSCPVSTARKSA